jgi:hypothetical protein
METHLLIAQTTAGWMLLRMPDGLRVDGKTF